ncbi:MAG: hypothetical protein P8I91_00295 [Phycisphaerales bacterium]|nr:hypothetical protein [Phycisphaerales bacterium]
MPAATRSAIALLLLATAASGTDEPTDPPAWPKIAIGYQDSAPAGDWSPAKAWFISGYALGAKLRTTVDEFIAISDDELTQQITTYLSRHPSLNAKTTGFVILDIESPEPPSKIAGLLETESPELGQRRFAAVVQAYKRRIAIVRQALPNATLCLYDVGSPAARGKDSSEWRSRVVAQRMAAEQGLLTFIDGVCPVLYSRYGKSESGYKTNTAAAQNAIAACREITQGIEPAPQIIPLLSFAIYNGNSTDNRLAASTTGVAERLQVLSKLGIGQVIFWNAGPTLPDSDESTKTWATSLEALQPRSPVGE